jgi:hypothetical protein
MTTGQMQRIPRLYHFTDRRNLASIRKHGGLLCWAELVKRGIKVPAPGGNDWSHQEDERRGLDGYVHLCFRENHPMEYRARQENRITDSIFLQISPAVLTLPEVRFSADVANKRGVESVPIAEAAQHIDFDILYTYVKDETWKQRLAKAEKYEVLVPDRIALSLIGNI